MVKNSVDDRKEQSQRIYKAIPVYIATAANTRNLVLSGLHCHVPYDKPLSMQLIIIWDRKGALRAEAEFLFLTANNFKAVIATGLKPGIIILLSLLYTHLNFRAPPISYVGVAIASIARGQKTAVLCLTLELHHFT